MAAGSQTVEQMVGEDVTLVVTFPADVDVSGGVFGFWIARTLAEALTATNALVTKSSSDAISVDTATQVSVDLSGGASAGLPAGDYYFVLRRTDTPDRAVACWGPWVVVGG